MRAHSKQLLKSRKIITEVKSYPQSYINRLGKQSIMATSNHTKEYTLSLHFLEQKKKPFTVRGNRFTQENDKLKRKIYSLSQKKIVKNIGYFFYLIHFSYICRSCSTRPRLTRQPYWLRRCDGGTKTKKKRGCQRRNYVTYYSNFYNRLVFWIRNIS